MFICLNRNKKLIESSGIKIKGNVPVAIKFIKIQDSKQIEREYEILSYLNAIKNPDVEKFGIPVVYDCNEWQNCVYMVLSLFECDLIDVVRMGHFNYTPQNYHNALNSLILFKDFVSAFDSNFMCIIDTITIIYY